MASHIRRISAVLPITAALLLLAPVAAVTASTVSECQGQIAALQRRQPMRPSLVVAPTEMRMDSLASLVGI